MQHRTNDYTLYVLCAYHGLEKLLSRFPTIVVQL